MTNENNNLKIETIKIDNGNEVSFCPERGGIITSLKFRGKEILYMEEETFINTAVSVHGGIPILFPNAGPVQSPDFPNLKEHGFARTSSEWKAEIRDGGFIETLLPEEKNKQSFPFDFQFTFETRFEDNNSFTIIEKVENKEQSKNLPLSMGLHPYFKVPREEKANIKFNFEGGKFIEEQIGLWSNGEYICVDNPKTKDSSAVLEIEIPTIGTLVINPSAEYKKIWIWSQPEKDFICIEPMMRDKGGLTSDPELIAPGNTYTLSVSYLLKQ
jgi:galactose mutarotase-like enzyme